MIRLMIVDDQKILLEGLKKIFEGQRHIEVVSTLPFSELVEPACQKIRPDVILMDICMEGKNSGIALTERLKKKYPKAEFRVSKGYGHGGLQAEDPEKYAAVMAELINGSEIH